MKQTIKQVIGLTDDCINEIKQKPVIESALESTTGALWSLLMARNLLSDHLANFDETRQLAEHFYNEGNFKALYELTLDLIDE